MANKKAILKQLADFFAKQGKVLTPSEYKALGADAPIRFMASKKTFWVLVAYDSDVKI